MRSRYLQRRCKNPMIPKELNCVNATRAIFRLANARPSPIPPCDLVHIPPLNA